ncbi:MULTISPECIES: methyltransferase domain-containing protein [Chitinophaga]|uniref:methyltransferase domain-containing protein n=1 Tax=Chitinophaga TaxID=79328 RepID=UPI000DBAD383|nr:methyltransferase domain-containing protein [Chitinophaga ginsengisegetis]MDR6569907.1 SAM-dependent methyltransferase [Chitinophaga ginsengisegetis]MDR6649640.1 SAM-dependent methyltransferase [Chitinophaga ginsengisegetis]MDR6656157.1 SAM-dependent methyltransferase [Chitinophaga ginsengisegetis]
MLKVIRKIFKKMKREVISPVSWDNLRRLQPLATGFGYNRGTPVDRHYITSFLSAHRADIHGQVLEIAESSYSKQFGTNVSSYEVLHVQAGKDVTIIGDLTNKASLPANYIDCFICTQTFNFIYDFKTAIEGAHHLLKPGGVLLATLAGATQISVYDEQRWGDYWRFTIQSAAKVFGEIFGKDNIEIISYGNVLTCTAILQGITAEELLPEELDYRDPVYPIIIAVRAKKA